MHPFLKIAKYGRWWAIKTISLEGAIWVDVRSPRETLLQEIRQKKSENDYMIVLENFNKNLEQKRGPDPSPPPPPQKKKKIRFGFFVKIHLLENSK